MRVRGRISRTSLNYFDEAQPSQNKKRGREILAPELYTKFFLQLSLQIMQFDFKKLLYFPS